MKDYQKVLSYCNTNRGKEFSCFQVLEEELIDFYIVAAYSSRQLGSNESGNNLLRALIEKLF
ncbi:hypothetical protein AN161_02930 [Lysinibacillus sp. FJAT-14222]|nr:hypothetical protein AN161_02930 [Lysinibacillus sp. FJAT-14222]